LGLFEELYILRAAGGCCAAPHMYLCKSLQKQFLLTILQSKSRSTCSSALGALVVPRLIFVMLQ